MEYENKINFHLDKTLFKRLHASCDQMSENIIRGGGTTSASLAPAFDTATITSAALMESYSEFKALLEERERFIKEYPAFFKTMLCSTQFSPIDEFMRLPSGDAVCHPDFIRKVEAHGMMFELESVISAVSAKYRVVSPNYHCNLNYTPVRLPPFELINDNQRSENITV